MKYVVLSFMLLVVIGCNQSYSPYNGREDIVQVPDGDSKMRAAQQKAKETMDGFISKLPNLKEADVFVKWAAPANNGSKEHIWVEGVKFADGRFTGKLGNQPAAIDGKKLGDKVTFSKEDASDWAIFYHDGREEGGFTNKVVEEQQGNSSPQPW